MFAIEWHYAEENDERAISARNVDHVSHVQHFPGGVQSVTHFARQAAIKCNADS